MAKARRELPLGVRHARRAALLMLLGLAASYVRLPWTLIAVLPLGWAVWESVQAIRSFSRDGSPARMVVWASVGLVITGMLLSSVLLPYLVYPTAKGYQDCLVGANTGAARAECRQQFMGGMQSFVTNLSRVGQ